MPNRWQYSARMFLPADTGSVTTRPIDACCWRRLAQSSAIRPLPMIAAFFKLVQAIHTGVGSFSYGNGFWDPGLTVVGNTARSP